MLEKSSPVLTASIATDPNRPQLTKRQKWLLHNTWLKIHSRMDAVGVVSFLRLFETHPKTLTPFLHHINSVKEIEMDEWYQEKLRVHALRVMGVVEKTMHRLDTEEKAASVSRLSQIDTKMVTKGHR